MKKIPATLTAALFAVACIDANAGDTMKTSCVQAAQATATAKATPMLAKKTGAAESSDVVSSVGNLAGSAGGGAAAASYAKTKVPDAGMPNRLSMNVTVPKQTQGATFGEKVNQGLQASGGAVAQGASAAPAAVPGCDVSGAVNAATTATTKKISDAPAAAVDRK